MRFVHNLRFRALPMLVLGTVLTMGCGDEAPTAPYPAPSFAATKGPLSVEPRSVRVQCNAGTTCTYGLIVNASSPVTLSYQIDGADFIINSALTTCVQGGTLNGSCFLNVKVASTEIPGRRSATLVISESTSGTSLTVRLSARVS